MYQKKLPVNISVIAFDATLRVFCTYFIYE